MKTNYFYSSLFLMTMICVLLSPGCSDRTVRNEEKWIDLFNGQNLDGWTIKINKHILNENFGNTFRVEDSILVIDYSAYDTFNQEFGHIFYKEAFSHYKLKLEYRFTGNQVKGGPGWALRNSGIMFHSQSPESMLTDQPFPVSVEAQFLGGSETGERSTGNVCTPGTHIVMNGNLITEHCISSVSKTFRGEEWVSAELVVLGDSIIHHIIGGDTVLTYSKPRIGGDLPQGYPLAEGTAVKSGYIALQAESHPVAFRRIRLLDLSQKPK
jgi:hypothetical protein